jgi:hypothetical protein
MERRVATLKVKAKKAAAETQQQVNDVRSSFPEQREELAHDIEAMRERDGRELRAGQEPAARQARRSRRTPRPGRLLSMK